MTEQDSSQNNPADTEQQPAYSKSRGNVMVWVILAVIFVGLIAGYMSLNEDMTIPEDVTQAVEDMERSAEETAAQIETNAENLVAEVEENAPEARDTVSDLAQDLTQAAEEIPTADTESPDYQPLEGIDPVAEIDVAAALSQRILGDAGAPIKISEHSSFTCGHCGNFHEGTFNEFKASHIDTGKAYLVFSDFPLNAPALHASTVARCVPEEQYFRFVQHLFVNQNEWAYESDYLDYLQEHAERYGLPQDLFEQCLNNEEIQQGILSMVQAAQEAYDISSTPSFVVNNKTVIKGAMTHDRFVQAIEEAVNSPVEEEPVEAESSPETE